MLSFTETDFQVMDWPAFVCGYQGAAFGTVEEETFLQLISFFRMKRIFHFFLQLHAR
jgi:hypothetical protein